MSNDDSQLPQEECVSNPLSLLDFQFRNPRLENNDWMLNDDELMSELESELQSMKVEDASVQQCVVSQRGRYYNLTSFEEATGEIVLVAKDLSGSQFLINKLDERNPQEISLMLGEMEKDLHELMMHSFGSEVVQKLFEVINEDQIGVVVHLLVSSRNKFVDVCVDSYGTLSMQKLIGHLTSLEYLPDFVNAVKNNIVALATVLNSGYVIQKCVMTFQSDHSKEILDQIAINCFEISTHKDGCSVVQKCLTHADGSSMALLVQSIIWSAARLADNRYGNYVVQYIIKMNIAFINSRIVRELGGKYVEFSTNKYASNVVEDLFQFCDQSLIALIIQELIIDNSNFLQVLQNPFGNYVVQRALKFSKGPAHVDLWRKITSNESYLRSDPYGRRVLAFAKGFKQ